MLNIKLISLGKLKDNHWQAAADEYVKRLSPYAKLDLISLKEEPFRDGDDREQIKQKEADVLLKKIDQSDFVIALHERGKEMDSVKLAHWLEDQSSDGSQLTIIIGGPLGLHQSVLDRANLQLSLSKLTFPHQMVKVILLEQLYRAVTISRGKQYHY